MLDKFTQGHPDTIGKLNRITDSLNNINSFGTDSFIKVIKTSAGITFRLDIDKLKERLAYGGRGGGASPAITWAQVVSQPSYADPSAVPSTEEFNGRSWYTCRLVGATYSDWNGLTVYSPGQQVTYLGAGDEISSLYTATSAHDGVNPFPDAIPGEIVGSGYWAKSEEIRVQYVIGNEQQLNNLDLDIRDHIPWFRVREIIPIISRVVDSATRYYIYQTLIYGGVPEHSSLRWNSDRQIAMAVFT